LSVLLIVVGLIALAVPFVASVAVEVVIGWLLVFSGMLHLAFAWRSGGTRAVLWQILLGIVYGAIGIYIIARPLVGLSALTLVLGAYLLIEAILEFVLAFEFRPTAGSGWLIFDGIVTLVLAIQLGLGAGRPHRGEHVLQRRHAPDAHARCAADSGRWTVADRSSLIHLSSR
jgi:uncharacterized membrane protein HdeD (DUF308 family)